MLGASGPMLEIVADASFLTAPVSCGSAMQWVAPTAAQRWTCSVSRGGAVGVARVWRAEWDSGYHERGCEGLLGMVRPM